MPAAFAMYGAAGNRADFIFMDFNAAAEAVAMIKKRDLAGKRVSQVFPGVIESGRFEISKGVWKTREAEYHPAAFLDIVIALITRVIMIGYWNSAPLFSRGTIIPITAGRY